MVEYRHVDHFLSLPGRNAFEKRKRLICGL